MSPRGEIHFPLYRSEVAEAGEVKKNFLQLLQRKGVVYVYVLDICSLKVVVFFFFSFKFKSFKVKKCQS